MTNLWNMFLTVPFMVRRQPQATLLEKRAEAIRWKREGFPGGAREHSHSLPAMYGLQYRVQSSPRPPPLAVSQGSEVGELKELLKRQQEQLNQLTQTVTSLQTYSLQPRPSCPGPVICRRCQQPGHFTKECDENGLLLVPVLLLPLVWLPMWSGPPLLLTSWKIEAH